MGLISWILGEKKKEATKEQTIIDEKTQTEIKNFTRKSKELLETAEIIGIAHQAGKHSNPSIDALKKQINAVQTTGRELSSSLKALTDLPSSIAKLAQEQETLRAEVNKLKKENLALDKLERKGKGKKKYIDTRRTLNNERIAIGEKKISENDVKIKGFGKGEKVQELSENIKNNLIEFKGKVSQLDTKIRSIEKGPAPKPPKSIVSKPVVELQPVRSAPPPPGTIAHELGGALKEFVARKNLRTLVKNIENYGVYKGSREYLLKELDFLKGDLGVISDNELPKMQETLSNSSLTKKEFLDITNTLINRIDINLKSKTSKAEKPVVGDYTEGLKKKRDETSTETKETYRL